MVVTKIADNLVTPLAVGTEENYRLVKSGKSALKVYDSLFGINERFCASVFEEGFIEKRVRGNYNRFEKLCITTVEGALKKTDIDPASDDVVFIISTTKGHVGSNIAYSARKVSYYFYNRNRPIVVSNACVSGAAAQIVAMRAIKNKRYTTAIVVGADEVSRFTLSGFNCLKALSNEQCHPYSASRKGLNLGEAGACVIYKAKYQPDDFDWVIENGYIRNDANHISGPSRTAEGYYNAINALRKEFNPDEIAFFSTHGTATLYNDQMEAVALSRLECDDIPVTSLKGCYGHTLGAAGILESVISMAALDDGTILGTPGYEESGVKPDLNVSRDNRTTEKSTFIKALSGFGGVNAAVLFRKKMPKNVPFPRKKYKVKDFVHKDGEAIASQLFNLKNVDPNLYGNYPKYYKMDNLCRLGWVASEELLIDMDIDKPVTDTAVVLFNTDGCINTDRKFMRTIRENNYFPSPSIFVYTLPNIVTGEIAIRNKFMGETSFYLMEEPDEVEMARIVIDTMQDPSIKKVLCGWVNYNTDRDYSAKLFLLELKK